ncbi:MAG: glycosyltransferase family 4 protein [Anaerolineales bacterium]|nr:glycosyltransferase family 4 protein [Anaerolineales bacterium]
MTRNPLRIVLLHHSAPPVIGGVESVLGHHARLMSAAGHSVRIVAARGASANPDIEFLRLPLVDSLDPEILAAKRELDAGRVPPGFASLSDRLSGLLRSAASGFDLLIAHNVCSLNKNLVLTDALYRIYRTADFPRLILWHHDLAWATPRYRSELHPGRPWDLLRDPWPGAVHACVSALRRRELSHLNGIPPERIRVVPNGIPVEAFLNLGERTIGIVRGLNLFQADPLLLLPVRITPRKNLEFAVRTLAALRASQPAAVMVVTGPLGAHNPNNRDYLRRLIALRQSLGLEDAFHFLAETEARELPDSVIADLYRLADALFLPSREEGFGIPILEAGISRRPVFCSDLPTLRELGSGSATFFPPDDDPERVASLIRGRLQDDPVHRLSASVRTGFRWEQIFEESIAPLLRQTAGRAPESGSG